MKLTTDVSWLYYALVRHKFSFSLVFREGQSKKKFTKQKPNAKGTRVSSNRCKYGHSCLWLADFCNVCCVNIRFRDIFWVRKETIPWQTYPDLIRTCHLWILFKGFCVNVLKYTCMPLRSMGICLINLNYRLNLSCFFLFTQGWQGHGSYQPGPLCFFVTLYCIKKLHLSIFLHFKHSYVAQWLLIVIVW
jgi:hypothetical protein